MGGIEEPQRGPENVFELFPASEPQVPQATPVTQEQTLEELLMSGVPNEDIIDAIGRALRRQKNDVNELE